MKKNKPPSKFKFFESRLNSFIDAFATENLRYIILLFILLLFATVNIDNFIVRISTSFLFLIILTSIIMAKLIRKSKFKIEINTPYWAMVGKKINIELKINLLKGFKGKWLFKIINIRKREELEKEKQWKYWYFNPNDIKWENRWALKNPQVYLDRENESISFNVAKLNIENFNKVETVNIEGFIKKRGVQKIENIISGKKDPLFLTQGLINNKIQNDKLIYCIPSPRPMPEWPSNKAKKSFYIKNRRNEFLKKRVLDPNGDELMGLREARKEDPLKNTHWKTLAKTGKRFVMEREDRLPIKMSLLIDPVLSDTPYAEERFEQMLEMVIGQALNTSSKKDIDWLLLDDEPLSINNKKHWEEIYKKIALINPCSNDEIEKRWEKLENYWKRVAALRVITTRTEVELKDWLAYWRKIDVHVEIIKVPYINIDKN